MRNSSEYLGDDNGKPYKNNLPAAIKLLVGFGAERQKENKSVPHSLEACFQRLWGALS